MNVRPHLRDLSRCVICGSTRRVEAHHVGGRQHVAWFTMPLCHDCHEQFHIKLLQATGPDFLKSTSCAKTQLIRAMQAALVFLWLLLEALRNKIQSESGNHES